MADKLGEETTGELLGFAAEAVRGVGGGIARQFLARNFSVEEKEDGTPVTETDREAEAKLREKIRSRFPDHGIIGEEWGTENADREFVWVLDPIDGTKSFVHGVPLFGTLVGLLYQRHPVIGLIYQPVIDRMVTGDNRSAFLDGRPTKVRAGRPLRESTLLYTDPSDRVLLGAGGAFRRLQEEVGVVRSWGDCFGYLLLASGQADIMIDPVLAPWDMLPLLPILRGAGATVTGFNGSVPEDGKSLVASTGKELHDQVLQALPNNVVHG